LRRAAGQLGEDALEIFDVHRLDEVLVEACLARLAPVVLLSIARAGDQHDVTQRLLRAHRAGHVVAAHARQPRRRGARDPAGTAARGRSPTARRPASRRVAHDLEQHRSDCAASWLSSTTMTRNVRCVEPDAATLPGRATSAASIGRRTVNWLPWRTPPLAAATCRRAARPAA
jgi:hypothetical protein